MKSLLCVSLAILLATCAAESIDWDSKTLELDPVAFVRSVELAEPKYRVPEPLRNHTLAKLGVPPDNKKQGFVVGGAIATFTENVKGPSKQDVLDATLFAQLAADKNYDRERDTKNWYSYYRYILGSVGFATQGFGFQQYQTSGGTFTMDQVVIDILAAIATGPETLIVKETLSALEGLADSDRHIMLFSQQSSSSSSGNFQVYPVEQSQDGEVSMAMGAFYFTATNHVTNFLFFDWDSADAKIYKGGQKITLNQEVYNKVRNVVSTKIGDNAVNLVASIDLF